VGEYTVVEPPRRLAFSWVWDDDSGNPQVIELEFSQSEGLTTVVMINSGIPTETREESQKGGWHACFDNLERAFGAAM
jgi:uncharacterized protein YndB with AHSA1/START domain